jgi:hypothetical protein
VFAELTNRKLRRSTHHSVAELEADVGVRIDAWNADLKPFGWTKTADEILANLAHYLTRINQSILALRTSSSLARCGTMLLQSIR